MHYLAPSKAPLPSPQRKRPCPSGPSAPYEGGGHAQPTEPPGRGPPRPGVQNALSPSPGETSFHHRREHHSRGTCPDRKTEDKPFRPLSTSLAQREHPPPCPAEGARQPLLGNQRAGPGRPRMRGSSPSRLGFRLNGNCSHSKSFRPHSQPEERAAQGSAVTPKLERHATNTGSPAKAAAASGSPVLPTCPHWPVPASPS